MSIIKILDQNTINKIAAGEVIDRPASVVKELLENAIDAKAKSITVEIKDGGISFIRITDNGVGISKEDIPVAFLRHSTSKITDALDLLTISSLGFRGEALSSIAAVSQVELISKPVDQMSGTRYMIEGGKEKQLEEIGAPNGTTFIIRNLFYNTPARKKFLKIAATEAGYINGIVERIALSHPDISIRFINNNANKLFTGGNDDLKNVIYNVYGKEAAGGLLEVKAENEYISLSGFVGKPFISRGNRDYENFFINGRYIKSNLISSAIEEAYKPYSMQHKYPFTVLHFHIEGSLIDVNVHPSKMEIRLENPNNIYHFIYETIRDALKIKENIPEIKIEAPKTSEIHQKTQEPKQKVSYPEPFETKRIQLIKEEPVYKTDYNQQVHDEPEVKQEIGPEPKQIELFTDKFLSSEAIIKHKIIGQLFDTYWLVEYEDNLFILDQHAAHEKVLYERTIKSLETREYSVQNLAVPIIVTLSMKEEELLLKYMDEFQKIGFEIENFGGNEYAIRAVPYNLFSINSKELFISILDELSDEITHSGHTMITEKIASVSCKAAVKGNQRLSYAEMNELIKELLTLENPYNCPHGRPTIISMSKQEIERKFKRIL